MVLEARYKAEKIGYPVVGEPQRDGADVVDYGIRDEQTKDISAEINANNQTTTGMATVIPGINTTKLIDSTSIYKKPATSHLSAYSQLGIYNISSANSPMTIDLTQFTISDESGTQKFIQTSGGLRVPSSGAYMFNLTYPQSRSDLTIVADLMQGNKILHTHTCSTGIDTEMFIVTLDVGQTIFYRTISTKVGASANRVTSMSMTITKL